MKRRLNRYAEGILPLGLGIAALAGRQTAAMEMLAAYLAGQALFLGVPGAFRKAAAAEPDAKSIRGLWSVGFLSVCCIFAACVAALFCTGSRANDGRYLYLLCASMGCCLAECNVEWLYARNESFSVALCRIVTATACLAATACDGLMQGEFALDRQICAGAGIAWAISAAIAMGVAGFPLGAPKWSIWKSVPGAWTESIVYPILGIWMTLRPVPGILSGEAAFDPGFCLGAAVLAASKVTFRRSREESPRLVLPAFAVCAGFAALALFLPERTHGIALMPAIGCVLAAVLYAHPSVHLGFASVMLLAASVPEAWERWLPCSLSQWICLGAAAMCILAVLCDFREILRPLRAARIRRKAQKR